VTTPNPGFIYRTIGGILDIYIFLGPSPSDVNAQYANVAGNFWYILTIFLKSTTTLAATFLVHIQYLHVLVNLKLVIYSKV